MTSPCNGDIINGREELNPLNWHKTTLEIQTNGKGLYPFTDAVSACLREWEVREGLCVLYVQHTSASLAISESYDPTARMDLEAFLEKLVPEGQRWYRHTLEGPDDSSSHLRALITPVSLSIPVDAGRLSLGTWQGIYLFEHRAHAQRRRVLVRCLDVEP